MSFGPHEARVAQIGAPYFRVSWTGGPIERRPSIMHRLGALPDRFPSVEARSIICHVSCVSDWPNSPQVLNWCVLLLCGARSRGGSSLTRPVVCLPADEDGFAVIRTRQNTAAWPRSVRFAADDGPVLLPGPARAGTAANGQGGRDRHRHGQRVHEGESAGHNHHDSMLRRQALSQNSPCFREGLPRAPQGGGSWAET